MTHLFIINPAAGKGRTKRLIPLIQKIFEEKDEPFKIEVTKYSGHATEIAKRYSSEDAYRIYSVGGDGTLNEVLNGIINSSSSLAVIPSGSGNDFFKSIYEFSKQDKLESILKRTIEGKEKFIDLGEINGRYFINIASVGFDAEVAYSSIKLKRFPFINGTIAYIMGILITLLKYKSYDLSIEIDDKKYELNSLLVAVANGKYYGGGINVTPKAKLDDGRLEVCMIERVGRFKILRLFPKVIKGEHESIKEVSFKSGKKVSVICKKTMAFNIDGEIVRGKQADFNIIEKGIKVVIPK